MPGARYAWSGGGGRTPYWPFALPDQAPELPGIAPEFRATLERILSTSRFYLQIEAGSARRQPSARKRIRRR